MVNIKQDTMQLSIGHTELTQIMHFMKKNTSYTTKGTNQSNGQIVDRMNVEKLKRFWIIGLPSINLMSFVLY